MSEKATDSLFQKQKNERPKIDDVISLVLSGDNLKNAQSFIAFLRESKMSIQWGSTNSWAVNYKSKRVCYIRISGTANYHNLSDNSWHISPHFNYGNVDCYNDFSDEKSKEFVWANIKYCYNCSNCGPGSHTTILGKDFDNVCHNQIVIINPNAETLECAKKMIEVIKNKV